ncbi:MAG: ATP-dependent helicase, partial [Salinibacterium sp.]
SARRTRGRAIAQVLALGASSGADGAKALDLPAEEMSHAGLARGVQAKLVALRRTLDPFVLGGDIPSAADLARKLTEAIDYRAYLRMADPEHAEERLGNLDELVAAIAEHESANVGADTKARLERFLDSTMLDRRREVPSDAVQLLTIHSAKGLEWPIVFLVGLEEGVFPAAQAIERGGEAIEEERRLCYVAMTRARDELHLSAARSRRLYGRSETRPPSRFLAEAGLGDPDGPAIDAIQRMLDPRADEPDLDPGLACALRELRSEVP